MVGVGDCGCEVVPKEVEVELGCGVVVRRAEWISARRLDRAEGFLRRR